MQIIFSAMTFIVRLSEMIDIRALDHIQLEMPISGETTARAFYAGVLGFSTVAKPHPLAQRGGCWFQHNKINLHIGVSDSFKPLAKAHICLTVADIDKAFAYLEEAGVDVQRDESLPYAQRFYARDPFGNRIEFLQDGDSVLP